MLRATPLLIKSNGDREAFDREKLTRGIQISCAKRPIPASEITKLANDIETYLQGMGREEVSSRVVGDMVIARLKELDPIAYIRFAIVYLGLDSLTSVRDMLDTMLGDSGGAVVSTANSGSSPASTSEGAEGVPETSS